MGLDCSSVFVYNQLAFFKMFLFSSIVVLCFQTFPVFKDSCVSVLRCLSFQMFQFSSLPVFRCS